jgi:hypothetical protein
MYQAHIHHISRRENLQSIYTRPAKPPCGWSRNRWNWPVFSTKQVQSVVALHAVVLRVVVLQIVVRQAIVLLVVALHAVVVRVVVLQPEGHKTGLFELEEWPRIWPPQGAQGRIQSMLRAAQGCAGSEQSCTATAQSCLFIAQVKVTCAQVSKWKWNLERSRFGCEYSGNSSLISHRPNQQSSSLLLFVWIYFIPNPQSFT